ncbi:hypothetical protein MTAT_16910 [Moorella thermoacetica]|uniref:Uncharacterized protein n=1 Tax=Neomoorella thermoacetica TaxID=1525 RepID=A0A1D7X8F5_NEOTH|nr:hypothetical protein [Moorella thermoacetica]AOQ23161.1 hypothetical protein Maut_00698 [Moorella thermoacetica]OIQ59734.1 hypothetical protein MOTE_09900 [Moorella thermoacetica]TYL12868.1 hypothetical protein MTAT_16910 [Moorella thermoacetica]
MIKFKYEKMIKGEVHSMPRPRKPENDIFFQFKLPHNHKKFLQLLAAENGTTMADILNTYIAWLIETNNPPIGFNKTVPESLRYHVKS